MKRLKEVLEPVYKTNPGGISINSRVAASVARIKSLNARIAKLGNRYNLVRTWGKYWVVDGAIKVPKEFSIYWTDIAEADARLLTEMQFRDGFFELHSEIIPVGIALKKGL
jgi:hypothetical protein